MTTQHDNEFNFNPQQNIYSVVFKFSDYIVTYGQPWGGVTSDGGKITVKAGRKGSKECAEWFKDYVSSDFSNMIHTVGGHNLPDNLNFAIKGTLTFDNQDFEICLGQGHRESTGENNWHLASKSIVADPDAKNGVLKNGVLGIRLLQNGTHAFDLSMLSFVPLTLEEIKHAITRYGPILRFDPNERYLMCSIEWFLEHSQLHDGKTGKVISKPTVAELPIGPKEEDRFWLTLDSGARGGNVTTAKAYVHAYSPSDKSYTDLQFFFFYAYNGPGTLHLFTTISQGDAGLAPLGEHFGDWETCVLRIDNATKSLLGVWLSQHDSGQWFEGSELEQFYRHGEQITLYSSHNGHAIYPKVGPNPTHESDYKLVSWFLRNDTDNGGESLDCSTRYELVSAPSVTEPRWLDYPYRWGPENTHTEISPESAYTIIYAALGKLSFLLPFRKEIAGKILSSIISQFETEDLNGPEGPKQKDAWHGKYD